MSSFSRALKRKQDILAKNAEAALIRAKAAAKLSGAQAGALEQDQRRLDQPANLPGLQRVAGGLLGGGGLPSFGGGTVLLGDQPSTGPTQPTRQQPRRSTTTAPTGFGLRTDSESRRQRTNVFGSIFDRSGGL